MSSARSMIWHSIVFIRVSGAAPASTVSRTHPTTSASEP